jgi:CRP-like cAMP-binding protein
MDEHTPSPPSIQAAPSKPRLTTLQRAEFIRGLDIFSRAAVEELFQMASIAREVDFAAEEVIYRENDIGDALYIVVQGKVELTSAEKGSQGIVSSQQAFGIYSLLTREPRYMTAKAVEDTLALSVGAEDFYNLLSHNMEILVSIFRYVARELGLGSGP